MAPMTDQTPAQPAPEPPPRRLTRSSTDRLVGGVAGGIGRHLGVDPLAIRITFVILTFAGGLGVLAYLACLVFVPSDDPDAPPLHWGLARTLGAGLLAVAALALLSPDWLWGGELFVLLLGGRRRLPADPRRARRRHEPPRPGRGAHRARRRARRAGHRRLRSPPRRARRSAAGSPSRA